MITSKATDNDALLISSSILQEASSYDLCERFDGWFVEQLDRKVLRRVAAEYAGKSVHIVLDNNARYQKCVVVSKLAKELGIELHYIPLYSPNLNLIERHWKHVKSRLRSKYYDRFDYFKETIDSIIDDTSNGSKNLIDKLIGESVQIFDTLVSINENSFIAEKGSKKEAYLVA